MLILLLMSVFVILGSELSATPQLAQAGAVEAGAGNIEGKETRAGVVNSSIWIASISATSNGSVYDMRMAVLICLTVPFGILTGSTAVALNPAVLDSLTNSGAHGLSEILYAYSSAGGNNGSAFA